MSLNSRSLKFFLKVYVAVALALATVFSPLALSFAPVLLLAWYLIQWRWHISRLVSLMTEYFMFFALSILFSSSAGLLGALVSLPVLVLLSRALEDYGETITFREGTGTRHYTRICSVTVAIALAILAVAMMLDAWALVLADTIVIIYFAATFFYLWRRFPVKTVEETPVELRILAGREDQVTIRLNNKTRVGGLLFVKPSYDWVKVSPSALSLKAGELAIKVRVAPQLSGPTLARLQGYAIDRWGLMQTRFEMEPVKLIVIPRARYAAWLAQRYTSGTKAGTLPLVSNVAVIRPTYGLRRGVEYYGNQIYQPGDSLKNIDWKHTFMHNELITKEFTEFYGQSAVILINLAAGNAEEADKLAYNIIVTAISLSQENVPSALGVYNASDVVLTTSMLHSQDIVFRSMQMVKRITPYDTPTKYLNPPDLARLRANLNRLRSIDSQPARSMLELLQSEYQSLTNEARSNPCTRALSQVLAKVKEQCAIVIVSRRNHDAEALAFNSFVLAQQGNSIISI